MSIAVFGSINIDLTTYAERLPKPGENPAWEALWHRAWRQRLQSGGGLRPAWRQKQRMVGRIGQGQFSGDHSACRPW